MAALSRLWQNAQPAPSPPAYYVKCHTREAGTSHLLRPIHLHYRGVPSEAAAGCGEIQLRAWRERFARTERGATVQRAQ